MAYSQNRNQKSFSWENVCSAFERAGHPIKVKKGSGGKETGNCSCLLGQNHKTNDSHPSMTVTVENGDLLVKCHAECNQEELFQRALEIIGRDSGQLVRLKPKPKVIQIKPAKDFTPEWNKYTESDDPSKFTYCMSKGVKAHGLRLSLQGNDSVPMKANGGTGVIVGIQEMNAEYRWGTRNKNSLDGSAKTGAAHIIGDLEDGCKIIICEGYATAATVYEATGIVSACAFGAGNLINVAEELLAQGYDVIVSPDDDKTGHKVRDEAQAKGFRVMMPSFEKSGRGDNDSDWNDLARLKGDDGYQEVDRQIQEGIEAPLPVVEKKPETGKKKATYQDYIDGLLMNTFPAKPPKRDLVDGDLKVFDKNKNEWRSVLGKNGPVLSTLESIARDSNGFYNHTALTVHYKRFEDSIEGELLLEFAEKWDGRDRVREMAECLNPEYFTKEQVVELVRHYVIGIYRKALDPSYQNLVFILQGPQGAGKDQFLIAFLSCFSGIEWDPAKSNVGGYCQELEIRANMTDADYGRFMCRNLVVFIPEFDRVKGGDATFKKVATARSCSWTRKYEETPQTMPVRASIASSANVKNLNSDPTGARRYCIIELQGPPQDQCPEGHSPAIRWGGYEDAARDHKQVLAQIREESQQWQGLSAETKKALKEVQARFTPSDPIEDAIEEIFSEIRTSSEFETLRSWGAEKIKIKGAEVECYRIINKQIDVLLQMASKNHNVTVTQIRERLGTDYKWRTNTSRGYWVPKS